MFAKLAILFTVVPILELFVLIPLGQQIGTWPTVGIVVATALVGAMLGKVQGASAWKRIKEAMSSGQLPGDALLDGLAVLVASVLLVTPGILTDITGLMLLIPFTRAPIKSIARKKLGHWLKDEEMGFFGVSDAAFFDAGYQDPSHTSHPDDIVMEPKASPKKEKVAAGPHRLEVVD